MSDLEEYHRENYQLASWEEGDSHQTLALLYPLEWGYSYALKLTGSVFLPLYD